MKKAILYCILAIGMMANAQTNNVITKKLQLENVPLGNKNDSVLVWSANKVVKHRKLSDLIQGSGGSATEYKFGVQDSIATENRRFNLTDKSLELFTDVLSPNQVFYDENISYYENEFWDDSSKSYYEAYNENGDYLDLGPSVTLIFKDTLNVLHDVVFTQEPILDPSYIYYLANKVEPSWTIVSRIYYDNFINLKAKLPETNKIQKETDYISLVDENFKFKKIKAKNLINLNSFDGDIYSYSDGNNKNRSFSFFGDYNKSLSAFSSDEIIETGIQQKSVSNFVSNEINFLQDIYDRQINKVLYRSFIKIKDGKIVLNQGSTIENAPNSFSNGYFGSTEVSFNAPISNIKVNFPTHYYENSRPNPDAPFTLPLMVNGYYANEYGEIIIPNLNKIISINEPPIQGVTQGVLGEIRGADGFIYLCAGGTAWTRAALSTF